jgi:hypothetical protein
VVTATDFVTTFQNQWLENLRRSQQGVVDALGLWTESFEKIVPDASARTVGGRLPTAEEVIDNTFDLAETVLGAQRQFAKSVLSATSAGDEQGARPVEGTPKAQPERTTRKSSGS